MFVSQWFVSQWIASMGWLLSGAALAQGGALVGPIGEDAPQSAGTLVSIGRDGSAFTLVVSAEISSATADVALLWPAEGIVAGQSVAVDPRWMMRVEASTRPREETLTCEEMVETLHWRTPPGCASYELTLEGELRGEDAAASVGVSPVFSTASLEIELLQPADVGAWLSARGLGLDEAMAASLQPHLDRGEPVLAVHPLSAVQQGQWLPPVQMRIEPETGSSGGAAGEPASLVLPLNFGSVSSILRHELHVFGVAPAGDPDPVIENYPQALITDDCLLPEGQTLEGWLSAERSGVEERAALPTWVLEHTGRADRCSPCTDAPLEPYTLGQLGLDVEPSRARLSRIWMSAAPAGFDEDVLISFPPAADLPERATRVYTPSEALEFALPVCGSGYAADPGVCEGIHPPGSRCQTGSPSSSLLPLLSVLLLSGLLRARRASARLVWASLLLLSAGSEARAAGRDLPPDLAPRTEIFAGLSLIGTDRVVPEGLDRGAPWLGNPYVAFAARRSLYSWRGGRSVGLLAQVRGLHGRAAPFADRGLVSFTLIEPVISFDVRHGRFREGSPCPHLRYGAGLALPALVPSSSPGQIVPSGALHVGYGWWIGRGLSRHDLEISLELVPRTDGFETRYHPSAAIPGFLWYPGTANLWISFGRAFYGSTSRKQ